MDKQTFTEILECALLSFDGASEQEIIKEYGLKPKLARVGIKLCDYLKSKEVGDVQQKSINSRAIPTGKF